MGMTGKTPQIPRETYGNGSRVYRIPAGIETDVAKVTLGWKKITKDSCTNADELYCKVKLLLAIRALQR